MSNEYYVVDLILTAALESDVVADQLQHWVRTGRLEDFDPVVLDVARYRHVALDPTIVLIGYALDFSLIQRDGRSVLRVRTKRQRRSLEEVVGAVTAFARLLSEDLGRPILVEALEVSINDRLSAAYGNTPQTRHYPEPVEPRSVRAPAHA